MTERLYYTDSYLTTFTARVVERLSVDGHPAVVLDRGAFYPTSGGQPHDTGHLDGVAVIDVRVREADGAVIHILDGEIDGPEVSGVIDWPRRFDHMQHHTGQHILTRAFIETADAHTMGFHLGSEDVTIDLSRADLRPAEIEAAEDLANALVTRDLPVRAWFPTEDEIAALALRKTPEVEGRLRVVRIGDFDATACGGTHVARTGEIGLIKVLHTEKYKDMTRVEFRCGGRALRDYREKNGLLLGLAADLTTGYREVGAALGKLQAETRQLRADLKAARQIVLEAEADRLWAAAPEYGRARIVIRAWAATERDAGELRQLASRLTGRPGSVALLGIAGDKAQVILARSAELPGPDMVALLGDVLGDLTGEVGARRGGGRPDFAQGGGLSASPERLAAALDRAAVAVRAALESA